MIPIGFKNTKSFSWQTVFFLDVPPESVERRSWTLLGHDWFGLWWTADASQTGWAACLVHAGSGGRWTELNRILILNHLKLYGPKRGFFESRGASVQTSEWDWYDPLFRCERGHLFPGRLFKKPFNDHIWFNSIITPRFSRVPTSYLSSESRSHRRQLFVLFFFSFSAKIQENLTDVCTLVQGLCQERTFYLVFTRGSLTPAALTERDNGRWHLWRWKSKKNTHTHTLLD